MKPTIKLLPLFCAGLGILTAALRLMQASFGTDQKGLLILWHPLDLLVWAVTAAAVILVVLTVRKLDGSNLYADNFGPATPAAIGCTALMGGIAAVVSVAPNIFIRLEMVRMYLGLLALPALLWVGVCRIRGKQPFFLFHGAVCLYLVIHTVSHYQGWCARPLLHSFFFPMAASICLTLFAYYQTAFDVELGNRRMLLGTGLLGSFLCLAAAAGGEDLMLYLGGAIWMLTNLCSLTPVPKKEVPAPKKEETP